MILAPLAAWRLLPSSRAFGLETFWITPAGAERTEYVSVCERLRASERTSESSESRGSGPRPSRSEAKSGGRARWLGDSCVTAVTTPAGLERGQEAGPLPGDSCVTTPASPRQAERSRPRPAGSRPLITAVTAGRAPAGRRSAHGGHGGHGPPEVRPDHGDHGIDSGAGHGAHGASHGGALAAA